MSQTVFISIIDFDSLTIIPIVCRSLDPLTGPGGLINGVNNNTINFEARLKKVVIFR